jgi:Protein of unknown function (DUF3050)
VSLTQLQSRIAPLRQRLLEHPLYEDLEQPTALRRFMQHHVFAVWDFMSLLKALQQRICSVTVPWLPSEIPQGARLVNEIVLAEESDQDGQGGFASHFELYHRAMRRFGADTSDIDRFLVRLRGGDSLPDAITRAELSEPVTRFVSHTFSVIDRGEACQIAAAFTFGREDLLPDVFQRIVDRLDLIAQGGLHDFQFYLKRHIELDGNEHGAMAVRLVSGLCGSDPAQWQAAGDTAVACLAARLQFWDAIHAAIGAR